MSSYLNFYFFPCLNCVYFRKKNNKKQFIKCKLTILNKKSCKQIQINNIKNYHEYREGTSYNLNYDTIDQINKYKERTCCFGPYDNLQDLYMLLVDYYFKNEYTLPINIYLNHPYLFKSVLIYNYNDKYIIKDRDENITLYKNLNNVNNDIINSDDEDENGRDLVSFSDDEDNDEDNDENNDIFLFDEYDNILSDYDDNDNILSDYEEFEDWK